jgi:hypothetical protein
LGSSQQEAVLDLATAQIYWVECQAMGQVEAEGYKDMTVVGVLERRDTIDVDIYLGTVLEAPVMQCQMISFGYFQQYLVVSKILSIC